MLAGSCFGNDAFCAKAFRKQCLADRVIDLVRTSVRKVFALQPDIGTPALAQLRRMA